MSLRHKLVPHHLQALRVIPRGDNVEIVLKGSTMTERKARFSSAHGLPYGGQQMPKGVDFYAEMAARVFGAGLAKIVPMTESEAKEYGPQWGSFIRAGDPGSIMYSRIPPERPEHRDEMVAYLRDHCLPVAKRHAVGMPEAGEPDDRQQIRRMMAYLESLSY